MLSGKETAIAQELYSSLPSVIQATICLPLENNTKFKNIKSIQNAFSSNETIKKHLQKDKIYELIANNLHNKEINQFAKMGADLESALFGVNSASPNLNKNLDNIFSQYNISEIKNTGDKLISIAKTNLLKEKELEILDKIITNEPNNFDEETQNYSQLIQNIFDSLLQKNNNLSLREQAQIFKLINTLNINANDLQKNIIPKYIESNNLAKNKIDLLNYADEEPYTNEQVDSYYKQNQFKILKSIILIDSAPLNGQLDHKIDKLTRTINIIDEITKDEELTKSIYSISQKTKLPELKTKLIELTKGFIELNQVNAFKTIIENINANTKFNYNDLSKISLYYLTLLLGESSNINAKNFNLQHASTIPAMLDRLYSLEMTKHKEYLIELLSTISETQTDSAINYSNYIHNSANDIGQANIKTNENFVINGLDYDKWLNYDKTKEFMIENTNENMQLNLWKRDVGYDIFQGNYSGICVATNGKNAFGAIDALLNEAVQIIEISNKDKTIGNAYTYWAIEPESKKLAFVIDGVTLDRKYQNDKSIKENLISYAKDYAKAVKGDDNFMYLMGDHYNSIEIEEFLQKTLPLVIIGNTGNRKYYLDSITDGNNKYVQLNGKDYHIVDVRVLND